MSAYELVNLKHLINSPDIGEDLLNGILSNFSCPKNTDVEYYLHHKAAVYAHNDTTTTYLVFYSDDGAKPILVGYFSFTSKSFEVPKKSLSKGMKGKIHRFGNFDDNTSCYRIPAPLIAQLGKNFTNQANKLITGDELLSLALERLRIAQEIIGGRVIYVECDNCEALINFYERNGFVEFNRRARDRDDKGSFTGDCIVQLLKYRKS